LISRLDQVRPADLGATAAKALVGAGICEEATIWIVDHGVTRLTDLSGERTASGMDEPVGQALLGGTTHSTETSLFLPLARRGQVLGVLEIRPPRPDLVLALEPLTISIASALLATVFVSDVVDRQQGSDSLSLPATIQKRNLPLGTYSDELVEVGGRLEPAYEVAGDAIDYAINPEGVHVAIFDAVGHGLWSTMLATLALSTYRLRRRQEQKLAEIAEAVDEVVAGNGRPGDFVTGIVALIRPDGEFESWNAGHQPPLLIRDGFAQYLATRPPGLPFGLRHDGEGFSSVPTQVGDVIFFFSDGVVAARDPNKAAWGEEKLASSAMRLLDDGASMTQVCLEVLNEVIAWTVDPLADDASIVGVRRLS